MANITLHARYAATLACIDQNIAEGEELLRRLTDGDMRQPIQAKLKQLRELRDIVEKRLTEPDQDFTGQPEVEITCPRCGKVTRIHSADGKKPPDVLCFKCWCEMGQPEI